MMRAGNGPESAGSKGGIDAPRFFKAWGALTIHGI
jgi:hypothetical protein